MRIILFLSFTILFFTEHIQSQDSTNTKSIQTKEFELLMESSRTMYYKTGKWETETNYKYYFDCSKVTPLSDSGFRVRHSNGNDLLFYKNINEITFYGNNKFGKGLKWGAIVGAGIGLISELLFLSYDAHGEEAMGKGFVLIISIPLFTALGTVAGGIAGLLTFEKEEYDFSKYPVNSRKEMTYKILLKHQINF
jgi:hypothetical protein